MSALLLFSNIFSQNQSTLASNDISKTIMSKLITTDFSDYQGEQLIEETVTPSSLIAADQEKYLDSSCTAEKQVGLIDETQVEDTWLTFNNESDAILKPKLITLNNTVGTGETATKQRTSITYYTVQMGDTVSTIARKFNISVNTILWANDLNNYGFINRVFLKF